MDAAAVRKIKVKGEIVREVIETHISWVLLTDAHAFKLKKDLKFSFLDFSTLEQRKFYCERELFLNRRLAPAMYLRVAPVIEGADGFMILVGNDQNSGGSQQSGGDQDQLDRGVRQDGDAQNGESFEIRDYAVVMKRMDGHRQMHLLLEQNQVEAKDVIRIAEKIAQFHLTATVINTPFDPQQFAATFNDIASVADFVQEELGPEARKTIDQSIAFSNAFIQQNQRKFEKRVALQMVRDGHGDLHSGNIFLYDDPVIFDCIEFQDGFRQIDLLNEIGFFCMDLDAYGRADLGKAFLDAYTPFIPQVMATEFDKQLFTYYKLFRANVRAKVVAMKAQQHLHENHTETTEEVALYLELMQAYLGELEGA